MKTHISLLAALVIAAPSLGAETKECNTADGDNPLSVSSPDQLDAFKDCTILNGHIVVESGYTGDFVLNGVTEVHGNISTVEDGAEGLGLFELRDLVEIESIHLRGISGDVHLPNLERAGDIELIQTRDKGEIDLGSLEEAENVLVLGSWTSTNFESLKTVAKRIQFCGSTDCAIYGDSTFPYIAVDLPSLEETNYFEVAGTVNRVSIPNLEVVGYADYQEEGYQGLRINIQEGGETLDFDAPKMHTLAGTLELYGAVTRLSMGALGETNVGATINPRAPLDIYSTIQTARHFYLWGEIHTVYFPRMRDLGMISNDYTTKIPCNDTLYQLWGDNPYDNPCLNYDFPQDPATVLNGTNSTTPSSTPSPSSSGIAGGLNGDANANSDSSSQESESSAEEGDAGNGAGRVGAVSAGLLMAGSVWFLMITVL
ncbi:hypothetical protein ASPSYDRAFT_67213 [Aspergillus sydowii CBS 593.65]|uniref:Receptor L-domain domain-containing protein n=1 Tax=Aspergillus sydowii CBS 593.65 TaxID=1036612 RepID=A0A1L9TPN7_9EURO|nr:uncharacterized protein ASPSYDRAFT_67213 [Aspergillus sydowii CBS 593.65]OJJ61394.1 hypothetical protein ASPSYDRAFT_67213 [Aspergillus sydowii CBS 593.65]